VMTSTAQGSTGRSFGWINRKLIASGTVAAHINVFGGEDRVWLGPEGGQFSLFFAPGAPFDPDHWFVPPPLDTKAFELVSHTRDRATFTAHFSLTNYSGTQFEISISRDVRILETSEAWKQLNQSPQATVKLIAYESNNTLTNAGSMPWKKETGLLSIWVLGMFTSSVSSTIVVPIKGGPESTLGTRVTSDYFGVVPPDRLKVTDQAIFLRADGKFRSKIGVNPQRSRGVMGSYDADHHVLTIVQFTQPEGVTDYVNSLWKRQDNPYGGDAANSYNDGPAAPGRPALGPFFELESSSPAAALAPGASLEHTHRTLHLTGPEAHLDAVARAVLGVPLRQITSAFGHG
jgi:hypothetical protein